MAVAAENARLLPPLGAYPRGDFATFVGQRCTRNFESCNEGALNFDEEWPRTTFRPFVRYRRRAETSIPLISIASRSIYFALHLILITVVPYVSLLINTLRMLRRVLRGEKDG